MVTGLSSIGGDDVTPVAKDVSLLSSSGEDDEDVGGGATTAIGLPPCGSEDVEAVGGPPLGVCRYKQLVVYRVILTVRRTGFGLSFRILSASATFLFLFFLFNASSSA
jgi:hypothetical protein